MTWHNLLENALHVLFTCHEVHVFDAEHFDKGMGVGHFILM